MDHENLNTEETVDETIDPAPSAEQTEQPAAEAAEPSALESLQQQYDDLNNRFLRMAAEYDNFRKRQPCRARRRACRSCGLCSQGTSHHR